MKIDELVALLDTYTAAGGYYIRPNISSDESSFFMAKGPATAADVRESFAAAGEGIGQRADKAAHGALVVQRHYRGDHRPDQTADYYLFQRGVVILPKQFKIHSFNVLYLVYRSGTGMTGGR